MTTTNSLAIDDPRAVFAASVIPAGVAIKNVRLDQLDQPTPCTSMNVRDLLAHIVMVLVRLAAIGRQEEPMAVGERVGVPDGAWSDTFVAAAHELRQAWTDDATLTRMVHLPWADAPGAAMLASYSNELSVHTWDLAKATGQSPAWDEKALAFGFEGIRAQLPADNRTALWEQFKSTMPDFDAPFADAVTVPENAALIDRLVAYNGRQP